MQVTFRLPSKEVEYGYVEVTGTPEELGFPDDTLTPTGLGQAYMMYVGKFLEGEQIGLKGFSEARTEAPISTSKPTLEAAQAAVVEATIDADTLICSELGGKVVSETANPERTQMDKPWEKPAPEPKVKPWENGGAAPKVADIDW